MSKRRSDSHSESVIQDDFGSGIRRKRLCAGARPPILEIDNSDTTSSDEKRVSNRSWTWFCAQKRSQRKCNYDQRASTVTQDQINKYLDVHYDCPTHMNGGEELQGSTKADILQDLLQDMREKKVKFPVDSYNDFREILQTSVADSHRRGVKESVLDCIIPLLNKLDFKYDTSEPMLESYKKLGNILKDKLARVSVPGKLTRHLIEPLALFVHTALNHDALACVHLTEFFRNVMKELCIIDEDAGVSRSVIANGNGKDLQVTMKTFDSRAPADESTSVGTRPNILFETVTHLSKDDSHESSLTCLRRPAISVFRSFCMNVNTTGVGPRSNPSAETVTQHPMPTSYERSSSETDSSQHCKGEANTCNPCGSTNASSDSDCSEMKYKTSLSSSSGDEGNGPDGCEDDDNWKVRKSCEQRTGHSPKVIPLSPKLEMLPTQHFMELLAMIKSDDPRGIAGQVHAFGFFVDMHNVYVTALQVACQPDFDHYMFKCRYVIGLEPNKLANMHYRMVCCKYFNIFKPVHFKAFIEFIFFLVFQQHKNYLDF